MPWKAILIIIILTLAILFIAFNVEHYSDISFIFFTVSSVPVYLTIFISMLIGAFLTLPLLFKQGRRRKNRETAEEEGHDIDASFNEAVGTVSGKQQSSRRKKRVKKSRKSKDDDLTSMIENVSDIDILKR